MKEEEYIYHKTTLADVEIGNLAILCLDKVTNKFPIVDKSTFHLNLDEEDVGKNHTYPQAELTESSF
jgi:hypothetical protein